MTKGELHKLISTSEIYKMSLGREATLRDEALKNRALVFASEKNFFDAVSSGDDATIARAGKAVLNRDYPTGDAPDNAISVWRRSIETFCKLPADTLIIHWESGENRLHWGISGAAYEEVRTVRNVYGQFDSIFHRKLLHGWDTTSLGGVPLSNIHPKAKARAISIATIYPVRSDPDYFRALIRDLDTTAWEGILDWIEEATKHGWYPKARKALLTSIRKKAITPEIEEAAEHVMDEIRRMAATSAQTAAYANGQTVLTTVKNKDISFTRAELEDEIASLLKEQHYRCALTGYDFQKKVKNPHLRMSLDRKNSSEGYVVGNLQVVTRAANFYKSASDEADWTLKARALVLMAYAIQQRGRAAGPSS